MSRRLPASTAADLLRALRRAGFTVERIHSYEGIGVAASPQPARPRVTAAPVRRTVGDLGNAARAGLRPS